MVLKIQPHKCAFAGIVEHKALQGRNIIAQGEEEA